MKRLDQTRTPDEAAKPPRPTAAELIQQKLALASSPAFVKRESDLRGRIDNCIRELTQARELHQKQGDRLAPTSSDLMMAELKAIKHEIRALKNFPEDIDPAFERRMMKYIMLERFKDEHRKPVRLEKYAAQEVVQTCEDALHKAEAELSAHLSQVGLSGVPEVRTEDETRARIEEAVNRKEQLDAAEAEIIKNAGERQVESQGSEQQ
jgi:hypothetical protein